MTEARANNEPIEAPPAGTDQLAADISGGEQVTKDDEAPTGGDETDESQFEAVNPAEEKSSKALDPDAPSE